MIKQVSVTFEFNPETEMVSALKCFVDGIEKKKTTTRKPKEIILEKESIITLESNKLVFNNKAVSEMELEYQNRVIIKYEKIPGVKAPFPIIGKDTSFDEEGNGNQVTKGNTVSYRGNANTILSGYGSEFNIVPYKGDTWKLVSTSGEILMESYDAIVDKAEKEEVTVFTGDESNEEIEEMSFKL